MGYKMITRETLTLSIDDVKPNPKNPRTIKKEQLERLATSIKEFPDMMSLRPIVVDENNTILGGNMRWQALKKLGRETVEVTRADGLTESQKREFIVKDNVAFGDWDWDELANEYDIQELKDWGLEDIQIEEPEDEIVEDTPPELEDDTVSKPGEIYQLGDHRLGCGDSTDRSFIKKIVGDGNLADLILTDPPYNVDYQGGTGLKIKNDKLGDSEFRKLLDGAFAAVSASAKAGASYYIWYSEAEVKNFVEAAETNLGEVRENLIWVKNSLVLSRQDYHHRHEPCLYGWKPGAAHFFIDDRSQDTIMDKRPDYKDANREKLIKLLDAIFDGNEAQATTMNFDKPRKSADHPTMKPIALMAYQIKNSTRPGELVLDPFGGSGSTLIAAEQTGRRCATCELDPKYCDVIRKRWWKLTHGGDETGWEAGTQAIDDSQD